MDEVLAKCTPRLRSHIAAVDLDSLSRVAPARLRELAVPHLGSVELVSGPDYESLYAPLYESQFSGQERERSDLIVTRLELEFSGQRDHLSPYRVVGVRGHDGQAIAAAQFSVLFLREGDSGPGLDGVAVPYLQYIYVRKQNRRQGLSEVLHTLILAVASADAKARLEVEGGGRLVVPFTFFETEPATAAAAVAGKAGGKDVSGKVDVSKARAEVHTRTGALVLMLKRGDGSLVSPHVQPGLEVGESPLTVVWMLRPSPQFDFDSIRRDEARLTIIAEQLFEAYYRSLRDEGFPEDNIRLAERIVKARCSKDHEKPRFVLLLLSEVTDTMYKNLNDFVQP
ncbi:hypothetical protein K431DRAFT_289553 [Polychaeton citri CBS 116435]|uniref:Uncharacterized protein n=1 Tax=Polychaeton citri CBS 116435 TaxID=1314669 RepID=A0A9P4PYR6_9PEZI|nr:hypothetical protein K431DRAFT_289553 [Polychaeton citri CBS 116435]